MTRTTQARTYLYDNKMNKYINKSKMNVSSLISQNEVYEVFIVSSSILCKNTLIVYTFLKLFINE